MTPAARGAVVRRLLSAGVLTEAEVVDQGVSVRDASRANHVLLVQVDGGGRGAAVKTLPLDRCAAELAVHDLAAARPGLREVVPGLLAADPEAGWFALDLVVPGTTLATAYRSALGYPPEFGRAAGRALGAVHRDTTDLVAAPPPLPWVLFALESMGPAAFAWQEAPLRAVLESVADLERHRSAFAAARGTWTPGCLVHGDIKWDNFLLEERDRLEPEVRIIDWESAGLGDPAWDVAGIVQEYLGFAELLGLEVAGVRRARGIELVPIAPLADALRGFFTSYVEVTQPSDTVGLAERAVRFAGVRLVQTSLEHASAEGMRTPAASALLDLALTMLEDPAALVSCLRLTADV